MANNYFHFTLGPVQGFVAQARRTRDFWSGSFLLSWLSGVAMAEVKRQQGQILFPTPPKDYLGWITGQASGEMPRQGAIPNRFKAQVGESFQPQLVELAVREAWWALAEHVWQSDRLDEVAMPSTRAIWERQHRGFWEISWAVTADPAASNLLDRRKNWRSSYHAPEPGVKCMVMDGWQELSGVPTPNRADSAAFWEKLRQHTAAQNDLLDKEQLSALAYVKRRFVRHFAGFKSSLSTGLQLQGWKLETGMPSVSYMAAVHWLEQLVNSTSETQLQQIVDAAEEVSPSRDEWQTRIRCLVDCWNEKGYDKTRRKLLSMDGNLFFQHVQDNPKAYGYNDAAMKALGSTLEKICQQQSFDSPLSPFYAILLMDGDSLGKHMADLSKQQPIANALESFTSGVPARVDAHNGYLIYAGGDDVLALLPLEDAMPCAADIRTHYLQCFAGTGIETSISAAIEFAHVKMPLGKVLGDAHDLLDNVAKDGAGRDALAVRVWKPGGLALEWAQPWEKALAAENKTIELVQIADDFKAQEDALKQHQLSNKFFYRIRERFDFLGAGVSKAGEPVLSRDACEKLLAVDYVNSADNRKVVDMTKAQEVIRPLLQQCTPCTRQVTAGKVSFTEGAHLNVDGALLVRFLVQKGVE